MSAGNPDQKVYVYAVFSSLRYGATKLGPPTPESRSERILVHGVWNLRS